MTKLYFIINPRSGGNKGREIFSKLSSFARNSANHIEVDLLDDKPLEFFQSKAKDSVRVIIAGGDGTISRLLPLLGTLNKAFGILPLGTGNDLAREFKVPLKLANLSAETICQYFLNAQEADLNYWTLSLIQNNSENRLDIPFVNYASLGFEAAVVADFAAWRGRKFCQACSTVWINRLLYALAGIKSIGSRLGSGLKVSCAQRDIAQQLAKPKSIIFANIAAIMGLGRSNLLSKPADNKLELVLVGQLWQYLNMVLGFKPYLPTATVYAASDYFYLDLTGSKEYLQLDGESYGQIEARALEIKLAGVLRILC